MARVKILFSKKLKKKKKCAFLFRLKLVEWQVDWLSCCLKLVVVNDNFFIFFFIDGTFLPDFRVLFAIGHWNFDFFFFFFLSPWCQIINPSALEEEGKKNNTRDKMMMKVKFFSIYNLAQNNNNNTKSWREFDAIGVTDERRRRAENVSFFSSSSSHEYQTKKKKIRRKKKIRFGGLRVGAGGGARAPLSFFLGENKK